MPVSVAFAALAGLLTILSPCILPVLPIVLGAGGTGRTGRVLGLVVGFGATFVATSVVLASILATAGLSTSVVRLAAALVLVAFGLSLVVPPLGAAVERTLARRAPSMPVVGDGLPGGLVLGAAIGLVWAPCVGPLMAAAIATSVVAGPGLDSIVVASAYVAGASIPLAAIALAGRRGIGALGSAAARARVVRGFGVVTVAGGLLVATGLDAPIQGAVAGVLPQGWSSALLAVEELPGSGKASARTTEVGSVSLDDLGVAPELRGITAWINSQPLTMASLRGKVVLVHFWTFGCVNCRNVQPYVKDWAARYADAGLVVIGVHTPELSFERDLDNVRDAVAEAHVSFPVAFDPDYATWRAYENHWWPAFYFVDKTGRIRHERFGEGDYAGSEQVIRELLAEP